MGEEKAGEIATLGGGRGLSTLHSSLFGNITL